MKVIVHEIFFHGHTDDLGPYRFSLIMDLFNPPWKAWPLRIPSTTKLLVEVRDGDPEIQLRDLVSNMLAFHKKYRRGNEDNKDGNSHRG